MLDGLARYLESAAPHIGPHVEICPTLPASPAGLCVPNPQDAYRSTWYLSPRQHVLEGLAAVFLLVPSLAFMLGQCRTELRHHAARNGDKTYRRVGAVQHLWAWSLLASVLGGAFLKFQADRADLGSHPAFLWQPCHAHSVILAVSSLIDAEWARAVFHVAVTLWWGPLLAVVAPDLPSEPLQIVLFYAQHVLMLMAVLFRVNMGSDWLFRSVSWNFLGWLALLCYHYWALVPVSIATGINVATMMSPPAAIAHWGSAYRVLWSCCCAGLHTLAVSVVLALAYLSGRWPTAAAAGVNASAYSTPPRAKSRQKKAKNATLLSGAAGAGKSTADSNGNGAAAAISNGTGSGGRANGVGKGNGAVNGHAKMPFTDGELPDDLVPLTEEQQKAFMNGDVSWKKGLHRKD